MKDNRKKILFVLPSMAGGGAEKVVTTLLSYLDRTKYDLALILFNKKGEHLNSVPNDVQIFDFHKRSRWDFIRLILKLKRLIESERPESLISFLEYANIVTGFAFLLSSYKSKLVLSERSNPSMYLPFERSGFLKKFLMRSIYKKADKIIVVSKGIKKTLIDQFNVPDSKIVAIYNPINIEEVNFLTKENVYHPFFDKRPHIPVIIAVGRLSRQKNYPLLLKAFASVIQNIPASLLILGQGELLEELLVLAKELHINKCVDFVGFQKNPFAWIRKSDLFVLTSNWEGFPNVIIEAMACGVPVIATDCPSGPNEIIVSGKNGVLVSVNSVNLLTKAIQELLTNKELRNSIVHQAFIGLERYNHKKIVKQYQDELLEYQVQLL